MRHLTDEEILGHLKSGEPASQEVAFRQLYREYYGMVESYIMKNNGSHDRAKDIFHDGMIVFFNKAKKDLELTASIKTYLYSICRNLWLNHLRKAKREAPLDDNMETVSLDENIFQTLVANERKNAIVELLKNMGEDCRKVLHLFYYRRMKMQKIKEAFGLGSEQAAKNKKSQCLKKLREAVAQNNIYKNMLTD